MQDENTIQHAAELLRLIAQPARLRILDELRRGEACVCRLQAILQKRQPNVSQHLMALREAGVTERRRDGQFIYYRLANPWVRQLLDVMLGPAGKAIHPLGCTCPSCRTASAGTGQGETG